MAFNRVNCFFIYIYIRKENPILLEGIKGRNPSTQATAYLYLFLTVFLVMMLMFDDICLILVGCCAETAGNHLEEGSEEFGALGIGA